MTIGKIILIQKDPKNGIVPINEFIYVENPNNRD